jgi:hypothetical protein
MSDGPHKSLPMQRHWRQFAERAGNSACPMEEVGEALTPALKREFAAAPVDDVRDILGAGSKQASLFVQERITQLEALRGKNPGSAVAKTLIDCAVEAVAGGQMGESAMSSALEDALESRTRECFRSVEEHYQREGSGREAAFMRERLNVAKGSCDYKGIASDLNAGGKPSAGPAKLRKRSGIDEGPPL